MDPDLQLAPGEARLLGVLVEKALTTPEQYPLSLNAATLGANQKSNRFPVLSMSEDEASEALDGLIDKQLARKVYPGASRVDKYAHRYVHQRASEAPVVLVAQAVEGRGELRLDPAQVR